MINRKAVENSIVLLKFCPTCGTLLGPFEITDILMKGFVCENNHRWNVLLEQVLYKDHTGEWQALEAYPPDPNTKLTPKEIACIWLLRSELRRHLNHQTAHWLRQLLEILDDGCDGLQEQACRDDLFCVLCGKSIIQRSSDDGYVRIYCCTNRHRLFSRGSLWFKLDDGSNMEILSDSLSRFVINNLNMLCEKPMDLVPLQLREVIPQLTEEAKSKGINPIKKKGRI
jgi:hypothetical protein